jgi:hypothetical protein
MHKVPNLELWQRCTRALIGAPCEVRFVNAVLVDHAGGATYREAGRIIIEVKRYDDRLTEEFKILLHECGHARAGHELANIPTTQNRSGLIKDYAFDRPGRDLFEEQADDLAARWKAIAEKKEYLYWPEVGDEVERWLWALCDFGGK